MRRLRLLMVLVFATLAVTPLAQQKAKLDVEGQIRAASFRCFLATILGDGDEYLKVSRIPMAVLKDGMLTHRDEKATRALLSQLAERGSVKTLSAEEKARLAKNMIAVFDDAAVQFIGANTAELTFLIAKGVKPEDGDRMGTFVLHRENEKWIVIMEVTDSAPIPPSYLLEVPKPNK